MTHQTSAHLTDEGIRSLRAVAERHVGDDRVPGLVYLVAVGDQVYADALGSASIAGSPMARDTIFRIASISKPITAAVTMALVEDGLIDLDEPVDRLLPELADRQVLRRMDGPLDDTVPARRAITTRDLLNFTFGFGDTLAMYTAGRPWPIVTAVRDLGIPTLGPPDIRAAPEPGTWIARFGTLPLLAQPGERWFYNTGASILGVLVARVAERPFGEVLRDRVFAPLGMRDTGFWTSQTDRVAAAYMATPDGLVVIDPPEGAWSSSPAFEDGAAGLVSTADDLLAFSRMLLRDGAALLSPESVRAMTSDQLSSDQKAAGGLGPGFFDGQSWGFCMMVRDSGAFGWAGGSGTTWLADPLQDLTVIVLTQRQFESSAPPAVHLELQAAAYAALG